MTRNILDKRLKSLTSELAEMGSLVEKQIYDSIKALKNKKTLYKTGFTKRKNSLFFLAMSSCFFTTWAIFIHLKTFWVITFIFLRNVVFFTANCTF